VRLREGKDRGESERDLIGVEQVIGAARLTGDYDYLLQMACVDPEEFEQVIDRLKRDHGAREIRSRLVLHEVPITLAEAAARVGAVIRPAVAPLPV
jgi:Lrp/AsnC family leucine-responsive transcriptional regulator